MSRRCTDPACPNADIDNHAHMSREESEAVAHAAVSAIINDLDEWEQAQADWEEAE